MICKLFPFPVLHQHLKHNTNLLFGGPHRLALSSQALADCIYSAHIVIAADTCWPIVLFSFTRDTRLVLVIGDFVKEPRVVGREAA